MFSDRLKILATLLLWIFTYWRYCFQFGTECVPMSAVLQEQQFAELIVSKQRVEEQLQSQCEELRVHNQRALQQVQDELAKLQREFSQRLMQAESEKQQVRFIKKCICLCFKDFRNTLKNYPIYQGCQTPFHFKLHQDHEYPHRASCSRLQW